MGKSDFQYSDARSGSHGTMTCTVCNKPITEGRYRVYTKTKNYDWAYRTQHEACCADDPKWAELDASQRADYERQLRLSAACVAFKAAWGVDELDEYILPASPPPEAAAAVGGEALARRFHETYERLAPSFGYATRMETRHFDPITPNGRLMIAVCSELAALASPTGVDAPRIDWPKAEEAAKSYVDDYEFMGEDDAGREGSYTPKEWERTMILDAIYGLLSDDDFRAALAARDGGAA